MICWRAFKAYCDGNDLNWEFTHFYVYILEIKGFSLHDFQNEVLRISTFVELHNDLKTKSSGFSGGVKRRLSVAMALIGDSKVIILGKLTV